MAAQLSVVHGLPSSQLIALPAQVPAPQVSPEVQTLLSLQSAALLVNTQPLSKSQTSSVQGFLSSQTTAKPAHLPPPHASFCEQALPSSQATALAFCWHPDLASQLSSVQRLPSLQLCTLPATQAPPAQTSPTEQTLPSSHGAVFAPLLQPVFAPQLSEVHEFASSQFLGAPDSQNPPLHTSPTVQALLSEQTPALLTNKQPEFALQLSVVQRLPSLQGELAPAAHLPPLQASPVVQKSLSLQGALLLLKIQPFFTSQPSSVHRLPSSHLSAAPPMQPPFWHTSLIVQTFPSLHGKGPARCTHPLFGSQVSIVQGLLSSQTRPAPGTHLPPAQVSPLVQALPSLQNCPPGTTMQPFALSQVAVEQTFGATHTIGPPPWQAPNWQCSPCVQASPSVHGAVLGVAEQPVCALQPSSVHALLSSQITAAPPVQTPP